MFKKTLKRAMSLLLVAVLVVSAIPSLSIATTAAFNRSTDIIYSQTSSVTVGKIRYVAQQNSLGETFSKYFYPEYWSGGNGKQGCRAASTSMALSYLGVNMTPKIMTQNNLNYNYSDSWNNVVGSATVASTATSYSGIKISSVFANSGNVTSFTTLDTAISNFQNGNGTYSPPLVITEDNNRTHTFLVVKKNSDGTYEMIDPISENNKRVKLTSYATDVVYAGNNNGLAIGQLCDVMQYKRDTPVLGKVTITNGASFHPGDVTFTWNAATGATSYNLKIWKRNSDSTETQVCNATGVKSGYTYNLKDGNYKYIVQAVNSSGYTETEANLFVGKEYIPSSYFFHNGNLYEIYESPKSWDDAKAFCEGAGGHLATITSQEEQDVIESHIENSQNHYLWLGASDTEVERTFKWVTGEPFSYENWDTLNSKEPNDSSPGEDYVAIKTLASVTDYKGSWNDAATSCRYGFICEYDNIDSMQPITSTIYNGHSYDLYDYKIPAIQAELFAQRNGGHLVSLNSAEEEDAVEELMAQGSKTYYWLGATKFDVDTYEYRDKFIWTTGEAVTYDNFGDGEPNNDSGEEWFVEYVTYYSAWNDVCNIGRKANTSGFIVEKPVEYTITYDICDGINGPENQTKLHGETICVSETIPEKEGFTFLGWSETEDSSVVDYLPGDVYTIDESIVLYAVWQALGDVSDITISSMPDKTVYKLGEEFNSEGLSITVEYSTGIKQTIDKGFVLTGFDSDTVGDKTIIVSYGDKTVDFKVSVEFDTAWSDWMLADDLPDIIKNAPEGLYEIEYADGYSTSTLERRTSGYYYLEGWTPESKYQVGSTAYGDWGLGSVKTSDVQSATNHTIVTSESVEASACHAFVTSDNRTYWYDDTSAYGSNKYTQHIYVYSSVALPSTGYSLDKDSLGNIVDGSYICPKTVGIGNPDKFGEVYLVVDIYKESDPKILDTFTSGKDVAYLWPVDGKTTLYRSVTEQYQYTHIRWTDWSEMSMEKVEPTDSVKVNVTENAYVRYRFDETMVNKVYDAVEKISNIPDEITMQEKDCVLSAQTAFSNLNESEKKYISQSMVDKLNDAVEALGNAKILTFTINSTNTGYIVTDCVSDYVGDIEIPDEIDGLPVTAIGTDAFRDCKGITSVVIPDSVTSIGGSAFRGCTNLTEIALPDNITSIPGAMCYGCTKLETVIIPEGVVNVGGYAFSGCTSLKTAVIPDSVTNIGGSVFANCKSLIVNCSENSTADTYADSNSLSYIANTVNTELDIITGIIYTDILGGDLSSIMLCSDTITCSMNTDYAGTGAVIDVMKEGTLHSQYTLVVNGDTNGDSVCDVLDCFDVERAANGNSDLSGVYAEAGDTNGDGVIDITDYQTIVNKAVS